MKQALSLAFDLRSDQGDVQSIDAEIRKGARLGGTNMWVLMFAILIASIGLNVNSTAVIIGAMLISPLMGPIIAIGYGVGVYDFALIRRAFINLGVFVAISLLTSTLYFAVTPYLHLPLGRYNSNRALNPGDNRWKFTLQGGLSVGLGEKTTLDVIGDAQWFGDNRDIVGGGRLEQKALYSLQPQISYQLAEGLTGALGAYHVWGGATQVRGVDQHDRTGTTTALGTLSYWLGKKDNLQFQYRADTEVKNGAKTHGLQLRFLHVF